MKETVSLTGAPETLLITLYGKAEESRLPDSLLKDRYAAQAADRLHYDFSKFKLSRNDIIGLAMRSHAFDKVVRDFLSGHSDAVVLHLGCGLDARVFRVDPPESVAWFDVDFPQVIALRRKLYPDRAGYALIGASLTETGWLDTVPRDRPTLIIAEGVLPYLSEEDVPRLFKRLLAHFASGEIVFDGYNRLGVWMIGRSQLIKATGATLTWSLDDPRELERQVPGLRLVAETTVSSAKQVARLSWPARAAVAIFARVPMFRRFGRMLTYRFG